jgi:PEP-CTERM motif
VPGFPFLVEQRDVDALATSRPSPAVRFSSQRQSQKTHFLSKKTHGALSPDRVYLLSLDKPNSYQTPTMKTLHTLIICLAATLATSKAQGIYDNFSGPAGPLASSPSASLWTVQASPADTASLDGSGNLLQTGGNGSDIRSTTSFDMTTLTGLQFKSDAFGNFFGGLAMIYGGSARGLYLRNDLGNGFQLWVFDNNGARSGASFTPEATGALWTLSYNSATSTASAYQNGSLVSSLPGITITDTTAQFYMFQYGGAGINTSYQYVATVPEPSTYLLLTVAGAGLLLAGFRRKSRA